MSKKCDPRRIKSWRSYKIRDICWLYRDNKLHEQTIRGWVKGGKLDAFWHGNTMYIYGAVLKKFLTEKNRQRKNPMSFVEFRCWKCRTGAAPLNNVIDRLEEGRNKSILAIAKCTSCGHEVTRLYKANAEPEILRHFTIQHNALARLSDSLCSTERTQIEHEAETAPNESLENKPPDEGSKSTSAICRTNRKAQKNTSSTDNAQLSFIGAL